jgi:beta-glucanase (GH16 family)
VINNSVKANAARWHTYGVIWSPGKLVYTIDGHVWGTVVNPAVSTVPMNIVLQSQTVCEEAPGLTCTTPWTTTEPDVDIAWVVAYKHKS